MYQRIYFILILLVFNFESIAQIPVSLNPDHSNPSIVGVNRTYHFDSSPQGFGKIQEFPIDFRRSSNYFEEERNTAWFAIEIPIDGILSFEIRPHRVDDDYDWMLFNYSKSLKQELEKNTSKLLRSNNARNDKKIESRTGLKEGFENYFESPGPGKCFSKPLQVKKGERQILVVDNIYPGGGGFDLQISLKYKAEETGILEGTIKDKITGAPLRSVVIVEDDSTGTFLTKTTSDNIGNYKVEIPLKTRLNIVVQHPDYLFQTTDIISAQHLAAQDFLLDKIAAGNKLILYNIHFSPNKDAVLPASDAELGRLINFLKDQQQWSIKLVGHTNNNVFANARYLQQLSFNRAIAVKKLLLQNGIPEKRISCAGMGGKYPVADSKDPVEGLKNLRVEVLLTAK